MHDRVHRQRGRAVVGWHELWRQAAAQYSGCEFLVGDTLRSRSSKGSRDKPVQEADGSTIMYLGPTAPAGKESNWLVTVRGRGYFAILRLYGPTEAGIDKSWKPGDIER